MVGMVDVALSKGKRDIEGLGKFHLVEWASWPL